LAKVIQNNQNTGRKTEVLLGTVSIVCRTVHTGKKGVVLMDMQHLFFVLANPSFKGAVPVAEVSAMSW